MWSFFWQQPVWGWLSRLQQPYWTIVWHETTRKPMNSIVYYYSLCVVCSVQCAVCTLSHITQSVTHLLQILCIYAWFLRGSSEAFKFLLKFFKSCQASLGCWCHSSSLKDRFVNLLLKNQWSVFFSNCNFFMPFLRSFSLSCICVGLFPESFVSCQCTECL